jgi:hypothetical protein
LALQERAKRVEALIEFLSELLKEAAPARGAARKLLADVYARYCLEPIAGVSTRGAFERELAVAYALAERGLGWSEELEKLANVFKVEQACSRALGLILAGSKPVEALEGAGARLSGAWVRALLGYARALHYLGYLGDAELAALFKALEEAGAGGHLRSSRKLAAAHKLAQLIASGQVAGRRRKEERKRALALLYGGGNEDRPSDALVWQVAVNVYGLEESKAFKLLRMSRARLVASVSNSASWWYRLVASYSELKDATAKLDPLWQEAHRVAAGRVGSLLPAAGAPAALALLEQAAAEGLDPDGFLAKLDKLLGAGGDPVELLLSWDARGWRLSTLLLATRAFEVKLERGYEMLVVDRVAAEEALEAGVKGLAGRLEAKLKEAVAAAGPRGGVAERWLKLVSLLLALEIVGRACELPPPPRRKKPVRRGKPATRLSERAEVDGIEVAVKVVRRGGRKYLAASVSGKRIAAVRFGDLKKAAGILLKALDNNLPKSVKPEVKTELQRLLQRIVERATETEQKQHEGTGENAQSQQGTEPQKPA